MHRIAFVVDRGFHQIGLHGGVAVPFCSDWAATCRPSPARPGPPAAASGDCLGVDHLCACSARSAIILAIAGKYLGAGGYSASLP